MARQAAAISKKSVDLSDQDISDLEEFLHALTGATALTRPLGRPEQVPSGIPVD
jgi:cytochrome c peroxidase